METLEDCLVLHGCVPAINILIMVGGTRGDVQPSLVLGRELQRQGHRVRLATHEQFRGAVAAAGLEFYPLGGDPVRWMQLTLDWRGMLPTSMSDMLALRKEIKAIMDSSIEACTQPDPHAADSRPGSSGAPPAFSPDLILANQIAYGQVHCAEALRVPLHIISNIPWLPSKHLPHPWARAFDRNIAEHAASLVEWALAPLQRWGLVSEGAVKGARRALLQVVNWGTTPLLDHTSWYGIADLVARFRMRLGLPLVSAHNSGWALYRHPTTFMWSASMLPRPDDWPESASVAGCPVDTSLTVGGYTPPPDLEEFLAAGPAPIYIGFGSLVGSRLSPGLSDVVLEAVQQAGVRALVCAGWAGFAQGRQLPGSMKLVGDVPHEWLFQRCSAVIHHGGVGTTGAGLRCGRPTLVVPFFGDLFLWGELVAQLGAGPPAIPVERLTVPALLGALGVLKDRQVVARAAALGEQLSQERGLEGVVCSIYRALPLRDVLARKAPAPRPSTACSPVQGSPAKAELPSCCYRCGGAAGARLKAQGGLGGLEGLTDADVVAGSELAPCDHRQSGCAGKECDVLTASCLPCTWLKGRPIRATGRCIVEVDTAGAAAAGTCDVAAWARGSSPATAALTSMFSAFGEGPGDEESNRTLEHLGPALEMDACTKTGPAAGGTPHWARSRRGSIKAHPLLDELLSGNNSLELPAAR